MDHCDPTQATSRAMGEVTSAVIATSLVLIAVFVPVSFFPGTTGILYRQFSLTIAFAIAISAFNALTLSPALAALFLRGEEDQVLASSTSSASAPSPALIPASPTASTTPSSGSPAPTPASSTTHSKRATCSLIVFFAGLYATYYMYVHVPTGFIPQEDQGYLMVVVQAPPEPRSQTPSPSPTAPRGSSPKDPDIAGAFAVIRLLPQRSLSQCRHDLSAAQALRRTQVQRPLRRRHRRRPRPQAHSWFPAALVAMFQPPAVQGLGSFGGFQFMLQDLGKNTLADLDRVAHTIIGASRQDPQARPHRPLHHASPPTIPS